MHVPIATSRGFDVCTQLVSGASFVCEKKEKFATSLFVSLITVFLSLLINAAQCLLPGRVP